MYSLKQKSSNKRNSSRLAISVAILILLLTCSMYVLEKTNRIDLFRAQTPAPTIGPLTKGETPVNVDESGQADTEDQPDSAPNKRTVNADQSQKKLLEPNGNFVSNHTPNLDGDPAPNLIKSTCVTTPGAICTITFTKNGETRSLPNQKTDGEGATYWDWKLQDLGLSTGEWKIEAKAVYNGETKTAVDSLSLRVEK